MSWYPYKIGLVMGLSNAAILNCASTLFEEKKKTAVNTAFQDGRSILQDCTDFERRFLTAKELLNVFIQPIMLELTFRDYAFQLAEKYCTNPQLIHYVVIPIFQGILAFDPRSNLVFPLGSVWASATHSALRTHTGGIASSTTAMVVCGSTLSILQVIRMAREMLREQLTKKN